MSDSEESNIGDWADLSVEESSVKSKEPEIVDLCDFLIKCGMNIKGVSTDKLIAVSWKQDLQNSMQNCISLQNWTQLSDMYLLIIHMV